jgi:phosphoribosylformimino-5-aminoimidazole carboxamide ribotide isomerase
MQVIPVLDLLDGHAARALLAATGARTLYVADLRAILQQGDHDAQSAHCATLVPAFGTESLRDPGALRDAGAAGLAPVLSSTIVPAACSAIWLLKTRPSSTRPSGGPHA